MGDTGLRLTPGGQVRPNIPVDQPGALVDEYFSVIAEQPDLGRVLVEERCREPLDALAQHRPRCCGLMRPDVAAKAADRSSSAGSRTVAHQCSRSRSSAG